MTLEFDREKKILEYLQSLQGEKQDSRDYIEINEFLGNELSKTVISCNDLSQKEFIEVHFDPNVRPHHNYPVRITTKGKEALQTTYNPEWIKEQEKEKQADVNLRTWSTRGTKVAIVFGGLGFFLSLIAIYISLQK